MDATELLMTMHREVEELFDEVEAAEGEEQMDLFAQLADSFLVHCRIEEEIFYPAVYEQKTEEELREAVEEHLQAKRIIADMLNFDEADEQWIAKCSVLKEDIQHHVEEEEETLFPMVREEFGEKRLAELGEQLQVRMEELQEEEEPRLIVYEQIDEAVLPV